MTGEQLRSHTLHTATGRAVFLRVVRPDYSWDNVRALAGAYQLWRRQARAVEATNPNAAFHANFAADVGRMAAEELSDFTGEPRRLMVVGLDNAGAILGINTAYWVYADQVWYMAVGTTRPSDQPGYPNPDQIRGIGLQLVGALVRLMNREVCAPVTLMPLDADARRFWSTRGFHDEGEEMAMSCPESQVLERTLAASPPDCPDQGDCTAIGTMRAGSLPTSRPTE